jgi:hypothetical protein
MAADLQAPIGSITKSFSVTIALLFRGKYARGAMLNYFTATVMV